MFKNIQLNIQELIRQLTPGDLKTIRIIFIAMNMGILMCNLICLIILLPKLGGSGASADENIVQMLFFIEIFFVIASILAAKFAPPVIVKKQDIVFDPKTPALNILSVYQSFMITRLAFLEAGALFGFVVLFTSISTEAIFSNAIYWLSAIPTLIMFGYSIMNFPTAEKTVLFYEKYKN